MTYQLTWWSTIINLLQYPFNGLHLYIFQKYLFKKKSIWPGWIQEAVQEKRTKENNQFKAVTRIACWGERLRLLWIRIYMLHLSDIHGRKCEAKHWFGGIWSMRSDGWFWEGGLKSETRGLQTIDMSKVWWHDNICHPQKWSWNFSVAPWWLTVV